MLQHDRSTDCSIYTVVPRNTLLVMQFLQLRVALSQIVVAILLRGTI